MVSAADASGDDEAGASEAADTLEEAGALEVAELLELLPHPTKSVPIMAAAAVIPMTFFRIFLFIFFPFFYMNRLLQLFLFLLNIRIFHFLPFIRTFN